jgi:hypothetical protein
VNKKLKDLNRFNKVTEKFEQFTDSIASKLPTFNNSNNSSVSQNLISNLDPLTDNFNLSTYNDQQIVLTDEDQI